MLKVKIIILLLIFDSTEHLFTANESSPFWHCGFLLISFCRYSQTFCSTKVSCVPNSLIQLLPSVRWGSDQVIELVILPGSRRWHASSSLIIMFQHLVVFRQTSIIMGLNLDSSVHTPIRPAVSYCLSSSNEQFRRGEVSY